MNHGYNMGTYNWRRFNSILVRFLSFLAHNKVQLYTLVSDYKSEFLTGTGFQNVLQNGNEYRQKLLNNLFGDNLSLISDIYLHQCVVVTIVTVHNR